MQWYNTVLVYAIRFHMVDNCVWVFSVISGDTYLVWLFYIESVEQGLYMDTTVRGTCPLFKHSSDIIANYILIKMKYKNSHNITRSDVLIVSKVYRVNCYERCNLYET